MESILRDIVSFIPIWVVLFVLTVVALVRILRAKEGHRRRGWFFMFAAQLALGALWLVLFFMLHSVTVAMVEVVLLWFSVVILTLSSWDIDRLSFWLLIPALAWITLVMISNVALWWIT